MRGSNSEPAGNRHPSPRGELLDEGIPTGWPQSGPDYTAGEAPNAGRWPMLELAILALIIAVIAGALGFIGLAGAAARVAFVIFGIFIVIALIVFLLVLLGIGAVTG
jgi:uncharacterized membrane protein YtjA (UPF0391 family)